MIWPELETGILLNSTRDRKAQPNIGSIGSHADRGYLGRYIQAKDQLRISNQVRKILECMVVQVDHL
jgi:hypothetical protein